MSLWCRLIFAVLLATVLGGAQAKTVVLTPSQSITDATEDLDEGDEVILEPGIYRENVVIDSAGIIVRGRGSVTIDAGGSGTALTIAQPRVRVENLTVTHYGADLYQKDAGVRVADYCNDVQLQAITANGPGFGIYASYQERTRITDCSVTGVQSMHVLDRGDGLYMKYTKKPEVHRFRAMHVRDGIYFENVDDSRSSGNYAAGAQYAIHYMYTRGDKTWNNRAEAVIGGYALMSSRNIELRDSQSKRTVEFGILLNVCDGCTVTGNRIETVHNRRGKPELDTEGKALFIYGAGANTVTGNSFARSDIGIGVAMGGEKNRIWGNSVIDNAIQVRYVGRTPLEWSREGRGNYWSSYMGWDTNRDGIGDRPYQPNDSLDRLFWIYPEARFLMNSPVVALLRWICSQFELDRNKGITDSHPLMVDPMKATVSEVKK